MMKALLQSVAAAYDVEASLEYVRGVPPTVNEAASVQMFRDAAAQVHQEFMNGQRFAALRHFGRPTLEQPFEPGSPNALRSRRQCYERPASRRR